MQISKKSHGYSADKPLPEILVGKKVRFQPEPTDNIPNSTENNKDTINPATNQNSDSLQDGRVDFLGLPDHVTPFFKRS